MTTVVRPADHPKRPGPSVQEVLDTDTRPVPDCLRVELNDYVGPKKLDIERYVSRDFYDREKERLWSRVWQWVCRVEEIPEVGDHIVYDIADISFVVVRSAPDQIRAFYNACLHRGRQLCDEDGQSAAFKCKFHGFTWNLDGSLRLIPDEWDFEHVDQSTFCLPEAKVATWGGFVFINPDPDAMPLDEYLGDATTHLAVWDLEHRYKALHLGKIIEANWKVAQDAFLENMHAIATHSQLLPAFGDSNMQYDASAEQPHWSRMLGLIGVPSPNLKRDEITGDQMLETLQILLGPEQHVVPEGMTVRTFAAEKMRERMGEFMGKDFADVSDSEMLDLIAYHLFPNFLVFGGWDTGGLIYRFRPWNDRHDQCMWEIVAMLPVVDGVTPPAPAKLRILADDETWGDTELGPTGEFLDQDLDNIPFVQKGLMTTRRTTVVLGSYLERMVQRFHETLDSYLA